MRLFQEEDGDPELYQITKYEYDRETFVPRIYDFRELLSRQTDMLLGDLWHYEVQISAWQHV